MKYKIGDKVRIKSLDWYNQMLANKDKRAYRTPSSGCELIGVWCGNRIFKNDMIKFCGQVMTIKAIENEYYVMHEDTSGYWYCDEMIEGLVEEETKPEFDYVAAMDDLMGLDIEKSCILNDFDEYKKAVKKHGYFSEEALTRKLFINLRKNGTAQNVLENFGFNLPDGYIFKDENGNIINATKIVLEKKKKEYPKTYEECCKIMQVARHTIWFDYDDVSSISEEGDEYECHIENTLCAFRKLLICRDAYWKIAGDEMGLGKPWEPDWNTKDNHFYTIYTFNGKIECAATSHRNAVLIFPTEEMRDAFKENFDPDIEICKEFL